MARGIESAHGGRWCRTAPDPIGAIWLTEKQILLLGRRGRGRTEPGSRKNPSELAGKTVPHSPQRLAALCEADMHGSSSPGPLTNEALRMQRHHGAPARWLSDCAGLIAQHRGDRSWWWKRCWTDGGVRLRFKKSSRSVVFSIAEAETTKAAPRPHVVQEQLGAARSRHLLLPRLVRSLAVNDGSICFVYCIISLI